MHFIDFEALASWTPAKANVKMFPMQKPIESYTKNL